MLKMDSSEVKGEYVLILGGGKFGVKAAEFLKSSGARAILVDTNPKCEASRLVNFYVNPLFNEVPAGGVAYARDDAVLFVIKFFRVKIPKLIIPVIPKHFVGIYAYELLSKTHRVYPDSSRAYKSLKNLPKEVNLSIHMELAVLSYMPFDKRCKKECFPSLEPCPITGIKRSEPLHQTLKHLFADDFNLNIVLPSYQLGVGVGGILGEDVALMKEKLEKLKSGWVSVTTACLCHGVTNFFRVEPMR